MDQYACSSFPIRVNKQLLSLVLLPVVNISFSDQYWLNNHSPLFSSYYQINLGIMDDKVDRLRSVQIKLMEILDFLSNYLPLVNCHSNDFILNNHWDKFLTEPIRKELDSLSACDLVSLLNQTKTIEDKRPDEKLTKEFDPSVWKFECDYLEKASNSTDRRGDIYSSEMQTIPPNWVHENLQSLLKDAQRCSLQNSDILSSLEDLDSDMKTLPQDRVFISTFMNHKKTHEVEVMGELCYKLSRKHDIDVVSSFKILHVCKT